MHSMNITRVDLNLLTIFDAVAQTRSVSAAAKQLSLSQPAVSHALNRLRRLTGDPLFIRAKGGLMPSPRALAMRDEAHEIIRSAQTLLGPATFDPASETRLFRIACSDYSNMTMLPAILKALRKKAPHCTLEMVQAGTSTLQQLVTGDINCSFWGVNAPDNPYSSVVLFKERLVGIICSSHPLAAVVQNGNITLEGYLSYPHAVVALGVSTNNPVESALQAKGLNRNIRFVGQSLMGNLDALIGTDLIMSLPARLINRANAAGFVSFELPFLVADYQYYLIWHHRTETDPASVWLRREITEIATNN
jgi:DNA-binding transcriptional LysR family regulator